MQQYVRKYLKSAIVSIIPISLILFACTPLGVAEPTPFIPRTAPTAPEPTIEATKVEVEEPPPLGIDLTAVKFAAKVFKGGDTETEVKEKQKLKVEANDRIEVVKLENQVDQSHSILDFSDFLKVELFTNAVVHLEDVREEAGGSTHVTLNLSRGHMFVELTDETNSRVTVETPDSTINTLEAGTEFNICKAPDRLTCVEVEEGSVEIIAQNKKEIVIAGEASFIFKDGPPSSVICAPNEIFSDWEERYRKYANAPPLSAMVNALQGPCNWQDDELPPNILKLYEDNFTTASSGWLQEKIGNTFIGYSTPEYYHVQVKNPDDKATVYVPNQRQYEDVNIDLKAFTGAAKNGDFRYGVVFRSSGDQYYAFAISPSTKKWYVLKGSSNGEEILRESTNAGIQSLDAEDVVRVVTSGPVFTFYINGQLVYQLNDADYPRGEVGLFVHTLDSPSALMYFDSIVLWQVKPEESSASLKKENCFNNKDDDGDLLVDRDDSDCISTFVLPTSIPTPEVPPTTEVSPTTEVPPTTAVPPTTEIVVTTVVPPTTETPLYP